jgi:hypothetical protein
MVVDCGAPIPVPLSVETSIAVPSSIPGHKKSTLVAEAYTTEAYSPFTFTWVPANSVALPLGSDTGPLLEVSQRPVSVAADPGLQAGCVMLAAFRISVITGFPESTTSLRLPVEEAFSEFVAVTAM